MHSSITLALFASATFVAAIDPRFEYPDSVPAHIKRQEPGTPAYACHEDCGLLITLGREDGYCDNDEWNERYGRCMICANTYNIWQHYGRSVGAAAEECGLSPTPSPSGFSAATSTADEEPASTTKAAEEPTATEAAEEASTTEADEEVSTTEAAAGVETTSETEDDTSETVAPGVTTTTQAGSEPTASETDDSEESHSSGATHAEDHQSTAAATATHDGQASTKDHAAATTTLSSVASVGTVGTTATIAATTPSPVIVNGGNKYSVGGALALAIAAVHMI